MRRILLIATLAFSWLLLPGQNTFLRYYGGPSLDRVFDAATCQDGGFIASGISRNFSADGLEDLWVYRTDSAGNVLWEKAYGGDNSEFGGFIVAASGGGFLIAGSTWSYGEGYDDIYLVRIDSAGNVLWDKTYGGTESDRSAGVISTSDGGFAIVGTSLSLDTNLSDMSLLKVDEHGDVQFFRPYGGPDFDWGYAVEETQDKGFLIGGLYPIPDSSSGLWNNLFYIVRVNSAGDTLWSIKIPSSVIPPGGGVMVKDIITLSDGTYLATGTMTVQFNDAGEILWIDETQGGWSAAPQSKGGYLIAGGYHVWKYDMQRNLRWHEIHDDIVIEKAVVASDGGYLFAGSYEFDFWRDYFQGALLKTNCIGTLGEDSLCLPPPPVEPVKPFGVEVYPNPAVDEFTVALAGEPASQKVTFSLYDLTGRVVIQSTRLIEGENGFRVDLLPEGIYGYRIEVGDAIFRNGLLFVARAN